MGRSAAAWRLLPLLRLLSQASGHYDRAPCQSDEIQGEVQGASGYLCAPRCDASTYNCPADLPTGASAQSQCMLQDVDRGAFCGLLCQVDAQCPSGARCQQLKQVEVGLCLYTVSFSDWAKQGSMKKLAIGWPSQAAGKSAAGFQVAKTYIALQNMKVRYSIDDGDADMLTLKELLASLSAATTTDSPMRVIRKEMDHLQAMLAQGAVKSQSSQGGLLSPVAHDINQFEKYLSHGLPGIQEEIHDTVWNIEHITERGKATMLLRGVLLLSVIYIAVGSFIKYQTTGARGIDMLPHIGFWMEYPNLVADGILYAKILAGGYFGIPVSGKTSGGGGGDLTGGIRGGAGSFESL